MGAVLCLVAAAWEEKWVFRQEAPPLRRVRGADGSLALRVLAFDGARKTPLADYTACNAQKNRRAVPQT